MELAMAVGGVLLALLAGVAAGYKTGSVIRGNRKAFWGLNIAAVVFCAALDFVGLVLGQYWLAVSAIGLMAGLITGLKYGYAESIGAWRIFDSWTGGDESLRRPPPDPRSGDQPEDPASVHRPGPR
jgi:hypothetical protein